MGLIPAKCTNCGANIQVDESKDAGICEACGTAFITEKAINNYNTFITNNVVINDNSNLELLIERAATFEKLEEYKKANDVYNDIVSQYPMDYRGWLGLILTDTNNFTKIHTNSFYHDKILEYFEKATKVANLEEKQIISDKMQIYHEAYNKEVAKEKKEAEDLEQGWANAKICNMYNHYDVEKVLGCRCTTTQRFPCFYSFSYVLGNTVKYKTYRNGAATLEDISDNEVTSSVYVDKNNINNLLSACRQKTKGCYVATCVYGSYDCPQVWTLRRFRDNTLAETMLGRAFIRAYYAISPTLVRWFGDTSWFKKMWKGTLDRMVSKLQSNGVEDTPYQDRNW